ncbi:hypothetical protein [Priestia megaterium]|uniref:Uncharacterized protein n=1 Tax=Priestia megaterium TaxID=1404 RepID=A0A6M6EAE6_PRIMG|nr:hypothetical protein [Priestia megaterium]QJX80535.1 hypothetical protein FDZ14_31080 [Priestia megaterium]
MSRNFTVAFLMLFIASITGGIALKSVYEYSMLIGAGIGTVSLLFAVYFASKNFKQSNVR